jgi:hypothetical protein
VRGLAFSIRHLSPLTPTLSPRERGLGRDL